MFSYNRIPDIEINESTNDPIVQSPNSFFELAFYQTKESTNNVDDYKRFLDNAVKRFRQSKTYTIYKGELMKLGLDKCQVLGNVNSDMATIEMHHCILTIFDVACIISNHVLNTSGKLTTFDLVSLLKHEHKQNNVPLCMLSLTPHQLYHNNDQFYVSPNSVFGNWYRLLEKYHTGLTQDIAFKILFYMKKAMDEDGMSNDHEMLTLRNKIICWSMQNQEI